jgi:hypothetical protein
MRARGSPARGRALPVRLRLKVGDDRWGPPVGDCGRSAAGMGRVGPKQRVGWRGEGEVRGTGGLCNLGCCGRLSRKGSKVREAVFSFS